MVIDYQVVQGNKHIYVVESNFQTKKIMMETYSKSRIRAFGIQYWPRKLFKPNLN